MAQSVEDFKNEWREKIRRNPASVFPADQQAQMKTAGPSQFSVEFGSDDRIREHLSGITPASVCCLVCVKGPFNIRICAAPPGASCDNMCL